MTGDELIGEGKRLARPSVHLKGFGDEACVAGVWGGPGQVPAPGEGYEHWLTIDCRHLPEGVGPRSGCLSVYSDESECVAAVAHDPTASLLTQAGSQLLFAHQAISMPPLDAVFRFGSEAVQDWLAEIGWKPDWGGEVNFGGWRPEWGGTVDLKDTTLRNAYRQVHRDYKKVALVENCLVPDYGPDVFAILGGWHYPWPDGDWVELTAHPLVLWTCAGSEPRIEVFRTGDGFKTFHRIT